MSQPFLITGLPRSRTAWMSVLCTTGNAFCWHEPTMLMESVEDIGRFYDKKYPQFIGASDCGLGFFLPWIMDHVKPRTVIIERDLGEVCASMRNIGFVNTEWLRWILDELVPFKDHPLVKWVQFNSLGQQRTIEKIWNHLLPGEPFDEVRYKQLADLKVTINVSKKMQMVANGKGWKIIGEYKKDPRWRNRDRLPSRAVA